MKWKIKSIMTLGTTLPTAARGTNYVEESHDISKTKSWIDRSQYLLMPFTEAFNWILTVLTRSSELG